MIRLQQATGVRFAAQHLSCEVVEGGAERTRLQAGSHGLPMACRLWVQGPGRLLLPWRGAAGCALDEQRHDAPRWSPRELPVVCQQDGTLVADGVGDDLHPPRHRWAGRAPGRCVLMGTWRVHVRGLQGQARIQDRGGYVRRMGVHDGGALAVDRQVEAVGRVGHALSAFQHVQIIVHQQEVAGPNLVEAEPETRGPHGALGRAPGDEMPGEGPAMSSRASMRAQGKLLAITPGGRLQVGVPCPRLRGLRNRTWACGWPP